ncbi:toxin [Pseudomonas sp. UYIF39]|uniref:TcdA/TcdB pore-forming domain-containing protein n=1 Tax=Pseudomonas sp. UYIF39 TaxID=1630747 RepID=UPI00249E97A4|nr:TcdA/TcdB pore-forming domain-containing protein [Pseudomonas sp. UYIF39]MDI3356135.1 toxin [Pseudomonas sp. UYIF39]
MLEPLGLLKQALASFVGPAGRQRRTTESLPPESAAPDVTDIYERLEGFEARLSNSTQQLLIPKTNVPDNLHFVWLGGGMGDIQRDYINIWKQTLSGQGYTLKLWYDSDALLAYETNRIIVEAAKADAMLNGGQASSNAVELGDKYEERVIALKQQMFAHINKAVERGESADNARIDLLVRAYSQDEGRLKVLREKNRQSLLSLKEGAIVLRDLATEATPLHLQDIYEREISLRGNFAAASDIVRAEALVADGGSYADVDYLPPLLENLGGVDISRFGSDARLGVLQLILDHSPEWMPGRQVIRSKYTNYFEQIPLEHREALENFAKSRPDISSVFRRPVERQVRPDELRAVVVNSTLSNAFMMAHPGSAMLKAILDRFRLNYEVVDATGRLAIERKIALIDAQAVIQVAKEVVEKKFGPLHELSGEEEIAVSFLMEAAATYYSDGIRPQSEVTIYLTGPAAMRDGLADYEKKHFTPRGAEASRAEVSIPPIATVNLVTEEELDHSWKENESDTAQWLNREKQRWEAGKFKTRYAGDITQLLKYQSIDFEEGWPVIEGRHVLITDLLQQLADDLGEPFRQAMSQRHNGNMTFEKPLSLSFDDRQAIIAQDSNIRPPASLPDAATQNLSVDELLSRVAKDPLLTVKLNPLQRLLLGGLLGVNALDNQHFDAASATLENLANTMSELGGIHRYGAIERELFKQSHPAFLAGLTRASNPPVALSETSVELKKQALERPLTLVEWGRLVARIQHVAKLEYRDRIGERIGEVLESFDHGSFKMVPQDLLLEGAGDRVAGRCYPLALAMAAALHKDSTAANTLRERFYLAVTEPEAADSRAFVSMIEELRGAPVNEIGKPLMRSDLTEIVAMLEEKTATTTVMLNSDNHSMLVAKTLEGSHSAYLLYDPNFGIFEFATASEFGEALTHFFIRKEMARHYAAFGDVARPTFDLIELNGAGLNATVLSSGVQVSSLSEPGALPEQAAPPVRQRLASARGQSLVNNAALGSSLLELDAHWWGGQIAQATRQLQEQHGLASDSVALFETLEITPTGEYKISLVNTDAGQTIERVTTSDHRFLRIKNFLSETFHSLAARPRAPVNPLDPTDAGSVHTLNAGFTIQALMNALRHHEGAASGGDKALTTAIRLHAYVNYAQLAHGNVVDVLGVVKLVRQALDDEKLIARTSAPLVQRALGHIANEGVGTVLGLVNVGFDIYQLSHATNDIEKAQFGTQLAFDSASAVLGAAGLGAALAGAGTVAAVLGGVGVILGGLAVGVTALAEGFATIAEEAKEVALFFDGLEKEYVKGGYHLDKASNAWIAHPLLVFAGLDLRASTVHFDSPKLFPLRDHFGVPDFDVDYNRAVDIRQGLGLPDSARFSPQAGQTIVLPCRPKTWYGYEYKLLPFVTFRHAGGYDTARRLEKKNEQGQWQFLFSFYSFPGEYVVNRLNPVYKPTVFNVRLDNVEHSLAVPALPKAWHGLVSYRVEGAGAQCSLLLNPGVSLELAAPGHTAMLWVLRTPWLAETDIRIEAGGRLVSGTLDVTFSGGGAHHVLLKLAGNKIVRVDLAALRLEVVEEEADPALGEQALLDHFKTLTHEHRLATSYTPVRNFVVPFEKPNEPRAVVAYYDSAQDRFLYIRDPNVLVSDEVILGAVLEDSAFFYHPESFDVWQVDAITGTLVQHYRLLVRDRLAIVRFEAVTNGGIQIVQQIPGKDGQRDELTYVIHDRAVLLSSITRGQDPALQAVLDADTLTDWKQVLGNYHLLAESANKVNWRPGALVSICWQIDAKSRDLVWVRSSDGLIIRAPARRHYARGWADSIKALNDLVLIAPAGVEGDVFVTYDKLHQRLMCQQRSMVDGRAQWSSSNISPPGLKNVVAVERDYIALTDSGLFFDMMPDGNLRFGGLTEHWFKGKTQWWSALATVALQYPVPSFAILGLAGFKGGLCAWYLGGRLLLAEMGHGKEVRLLSTTPDDQATWLFDLSIGKIVRQGFIDPDHLSTAFAQGTKLLLAEALPAPTQEWASWTFSDVTVEGSGLRATTLEGVEVDLQYNEPVRISGVNSHWVAALEGELSEGLAALANEHRCADFLSVKDPDYQQWYVVRTGRLIRIPKTAIAAQFTLVGTQHQTNVMLHDSGDGFLHTYPQNNKVGPLDYVQRNAEVLVVEGAKTRTELLPLIADDVSILVLKMGQGSTTCRLTRAAWLKLESVIVDCRHSLDHSPSVPGKLIWDIVVADQLWASRVDEHLVIVDADSGHSLIFRDVFSTDVVLHRNVFLAMSGYQSFAVSTLVSTLVARKGSTSSVLLKDILPAAIVEKIED